MNKHTLLSISLNFFSVTFLLALIITPIYFAQNAAKVAGVKTESKFLLVPQVAKFPGMTFNQNGNIYKIDFVKLGPSQAYLGVLFINNPTNQPQNYFLSSSSEAKIFFGETLDEQKTNITLPSQASIPISILSTSGNKNQTVEFAINTK